MPQPRPRTDPLKGLAYPTLPAEVVYADLVSVHDRFGEAVEAWWELFTNAGEAVDVPVVPVPLSGPMRRGALFMWARAVLHLSWGLRAVGMELHGDQVMTPNPLGGWTENRLCRVTPVAGAVA